MGDFRKQQKSSKENAASVAHSLQTRSFKPGFADQTYSHQVQLSTDSQATENSILQTRSFEPGVPHPEQTPQIQTQSEESLAQHQDNRIEQHTGFNFENINLFAEGSTPPPPPTSNSFIQAKLTIGQPNDLYEQEADRVAKSVIHQINNPQTAQRQDEIQRIPLVNSPMMRLPIQRKGGIIAGPANRRFESQLNQSRRGGSPLEPGLRSQMESAMGANFSNVKIHHDIQADRLSQSIQAKAFTTGQDVFFKQGEYSPNSRSGQELLAHELTHVVQQNSDTVRAQPDNSVQRQLQITPQSQPTIQRLVQDAANYDWVPIAKLYAVCHAKTNYVKQALTNIARLTGGVIHTKDDSGVLYKAQMLKGMRRAVEKAVLKNAANPRAILEGSFFDNMSDILRGSIKFPTLVALSNGLMILKSNLAREGLIVRAFKNRFNNPAAGYRDFLVNVSPKNADFVFELQFHAQGMLDAKNQGGHEIYDELRIRKESLEFLIKQKLTAEEAKGASKDQAKIDHMTEVITEQEARIDELEAQSAAHYDDAFGDMANASSEEIAAAERLAAFKFKPQARDKAQAIDGIYRMFADRHGARPYNDFEDEAKGHIESVVGEAQTLEGAVNNPAAGAVDAALDQQLENRKQEKAARRAARANGQ